MSFEELVSGRRRGAGAGLLRALLATASYGYALGIRLRNRWYDTGWPVRRLSVPVISVGNITVGGTGKTPMALWLCRYLLGRGLRPAVVSRGYKATRGAAPDEAAMLARGCPEAVTVADPDRRRGAVRAVDACGADVVILDDGFQHRRLGRDLDIVLIDATCPFGYGRLLPRGLLREPPSSLRRAALVVITRADQISPDELAALARRVGELSGGRPVVRAAHRAAGFADLSGVPVEAPPVSCRVFLFAGIARPAAYERTVRDMGFAPVAARWYPDHHAYGLCDIAELGELARNSRADVLLTTEKDAVKLPRLEGLWPCPVRALRIDIDFLEEDDRIMAAAVDGVVRSVEGRHAREESHAG